MWGLWNARVRDWFNTGGRTPHFKTREEAERLVPLAMRQYPFGKWEPREYRADEEDSVARPDSTAA